MCKKVNEGTFLLVDSSLTHVTLTSDHMLIG